MATDKAHEEWVSPLARTPAQKKAMAFSGKVEVSSKGKVEETQYFHEGKKVGTISGSGGEATYTPTTGDKTIRLGFKKDDAKVTLSPGEFTKQQIIEREVRKKVQRRLIDVKTKAQTISFIQRLERGRIEEGKRIRERIREGIDKISFGLISQTTKQNRLNQQIISSNQAVEIFNRKYGGRTLSESEFSKATKKEKELNEWSENIKKLEEEIKKMEERRTKKLKGLPLVKQSVELKKKLKKLKEIKTIQKETTKKKILLIPSDTQKEKHAKIQKEKQKRLLETPDSKLTVYERAEKSLIGKGIFKTPAEYLLKGQEKLGTWLQATKFGKTKAGKVLLKDIKVPKKQAVAFVSDMGKFVFFSPAMLTKGEIIAKIPKDTMVKFIGEQKTVGNKIVTDVVFTSARKRVGIARGVTIFTKNKASTLAVGRIGRRGIKFPTRKLGVFKREVFAGIEKGVSKQAMFKLRTDVKNVGIITKNIRGIAQGGFGRIIQVKGDKIIRTGIRFPIGKIIKKKVPGVSTDDFISIAGVFTKKDLNLIIGKTLTTAGDRIKFIGLIKGVKRLKTPGVKGGIALTRTQKKLYAKAMKQVLGVVSSTAKAKKVKGLSSIAKSTIATIILKTVPVTPKVIPKIILKSPKVIPKIIPKPKPRITPKIEPISKAKAKQITIQTQKQISSTGQKIKQLQKQKSKVKQKEKAKISSRIRQLQKQRQRLRVALRTIPKITLKIKPGVRPILRPRIRPKIVRLLFPIKRKKKKVLKKKLKKKPQAWNVFARPLKKKGAKRKPKLVKVNKVPLLKRRAKDLRSYIVDTSLARTGRIKPTKGKIGKSRLKVPVGYSARTKFKFRKYKIVKGKRKPLKLGKVIERRKRLLDTRQEKRKITLRRRIAQITMKPKKRKPVKRKTIKRKLKKGKKK